MHTTTNYLLSGIFSLLLVLLVAPRVFRINRGKILENTALWLAIFLALCWIYQNYGPGALNGKPFSFSGLLGISRPADEKLEIPDNEPNSQEITPKSSDMPQNKPEKPDSGGI